MEDEGPTEPSPSEETPKSLHVVCSPGGGAFSVYMFLRYTLAQLSDPHISDVKMTMLCREKKGKSKAEIWWDLWSQDENLSKKLEVPGGWKPEFILKNATPKSLNQQPSDSFVFILAGGDQGRLIATYWDCKRKNANAKMVTEEEMTSYSDGNFTFKSAVQDTSSKHFETNIIKPKEGLSAIEMTVKEKWADSVKTIECRKVRRPKGKKTEYLGSHDLFWKRTPSFSKRNPTRLHVFVRPVTTNPQGHDLVKDEEKLAVKFFITHHIEQWFPWKKSFRFEMNEDYNDNLKRLLIRRPDAAKLFANLKKENLGRKSAYNDKSILVSKYDDSSKANTSRTLNILAWDERNIGRSTQFLALMLLNLEETEDLLLLNSPIPGGNFIQSLTALDTTNLYNEDYTDVKVRDVKQTNIFLEESEKEYLQITLATIGLNGPSVKQIIDSLDSNLELVAYGKDDIREQIRALEVRSVHRCFMRGVFSIVPIKEEHHMTQLEDMWLSHADQISHVTWLTRPNSEARETAIPSNLLCTMDKTGKVLHVFDWKQNAVLELYLYLAFYNLSTVEPERFSLSTPHVAAFAEKTHFEIKTEEFLKFTQKNNKSGDPQNAELWFTHFHKGAYKHHVADAKAIVKQIDSKNQTVSDPLKWAESQFEILRSRYNWETLHGYIGVLMLSLFGAEDDSMANNNPYLFSKQVFKNTKVGDNSNVSGIFYSLEVAMFADYVKSFLTTDTKNAVLKSFQEYSNHDVTGHSNLQAVLPFRQSKSNPQKNQTSFYFFRRKQPIPKARRYSGFFFDPETKDYSNAFYFHNKRIEEVAMYALSLLGMEHNFTINESICGQFLCFSRPKGFKAKALRSKYGYKKHLTTASTRKKNIRRSAVKSYKKTTSTRRNLWRNPRLFSNRFVGRSCSSHRRIIQDHTSQFNIGIEQLLGEENLDVFNKSIRKNLPKRRTTSTIDQVKKSLQPPILTVEEVEKLLSSTTLTTEQVEKLQSLLQITPWLDLESPTLSISPRDSALDALSSWAHQVFVRLYSTADTNIMKKSRTLTAVNINIEVNSLFVRASNLANNDGAKPTKKFKEFIRLLNFFCREVELEAKKRYERYLELKAKRTSQSFQSDE